MFSISVQSNLFPHIKIFVQRAQNISTLYRKSSNSSHKWNKEVWFAVQSTKSTESLRTLTERGKVPPPLTPLISKLWTKTFRFGPLHLLIVCLKPVTAIIESYKLFLKYCLFVYLNVCSC